MGSREVLDYPKSQPRTFFIQRHEATLTLNVVPSRKRDRVFEGSGTDKYANIDHLQKSITREKYLQTRSDEYSKNPQYEGVEA